MPRKGRELDLKRWVWRSFHQIPFNRKDLVWFRQKGGCEMLRKRHRRMGQGGGDQRGESGRNALLLNGWCVSGSGSYQIFDEAVSSHLGCLSRATRTQVCCPQRPHTFPTATCPLLRSVVLATFCKIWTPRLI